MIALLLHRLIDLLRHHCSERVLPRRIAKDESVIELDFLDQRARLPVIGAGFAGKTDDDVGCNGDPRARGADPLDKIDIFFRGVGPVHHFENFVRAGLHR